jgi:hypothetical protein
MESAAKSDHANFFHAGFLLSLFFHPEDGGDIFLNNTVLKCVQ